MHGPNTRSYRRHFSGPLQARAAQSRRRDGTTGECAAVYTSVLGGGKAAVNVSRMIDKRQAQISRLPKLLFFLLLIITRIALPFRSAVAKTRPALSSNTVQRQRFVRANTQTLVRADTCANKSYQLPRVYIKLSLYIREGLMHDPASTSTPALSRRKSLRACLMMTLTIWKKAAPAVRPGVNRAKFRTRNNFRICDCSETILKHSHSTLFNIIPLAKLSHNRWKKLLHHMQTLRVIKSRSGMVVVVQLLK